ncbi:GldG family protein [Polyangium sp. 6x1]|uniref:GldG family protein n=1 Tax=Polyangium sp. 6x1 TaxID=3042689 RepID=UPI0024822360|nr:GldG family protein [Polyangium sp. 6x1]MDI1446334.1 GldG family protein [Polyangium sp. 6x1]
MLRAALALGLFTTLSTGCGTAPRPAAPGPAAVIPASPATTTKDACHRGLQHLRDSLRSPVYVEIYASPELKGIEGHLAELREVLDEIAGGGDDKIVVRTIRVKDEATREAAREAGLQEGYFESDYLRGIGFFGVSLRHADEQEAVPLLTSVSPADLRSWISMKIRDLDARVNGRALRIGVLTGTDEIALGDANLVAKNPEDSREGPSIQRIVEQALPFYHFVPVDLRGGKASIDPSLEGLLVTQPGRDLTDAELRRIDEFFLRGGKTGAFLTSAVNLRPGDASMRATIDTHGIDQLLEGYGVEMKNEAVLDWGSSVRLHIALQSGEPLELVGFGLTLAAHKENAPPAQQTLDSSFLGFSRLDELAMPFSSPLVLHPELQPEATLRAVARSTPRTTVDASETIHLKFSSTFQPKGQYGSRVLAATVEGKLRSAFDPGRSAPARLLVLSSAQFLANPYARAGNPVDLPGGAASPADEDLQTLSMPYAQKYLTATILAFKSILDWMTLDDDLYACTQDERR